MAQIVEIIFLMCSVLYKASIRPGAHCPTCCTYLLFVTSWIKKKIPYATVLSISHDLLPSNRLQRRRSNKSSTSSSLVKSLSFINSHADATVIQDVQ